MASRFSPKITHGKAGRTKKIGTGPATEEDFIRDAVIVKLEVAIRFLKGAVEDRIFDADRRHCPFAPESVRKILCRSIGGGFYPPGDWSTTIITPGQIVVSPLSYLAALRQFQVLSLRSRQGEVGVKTVYHYCATRALAAIVKEAAFHAGNIQFMNDHLEIEWFHDVCRGVLDDDRNQITRFSDLVSSSTTNSEGRETSTVSAKVSLVHRFYHEALVALLSTPKFDHVYGACFSEIQDDLSQWRGYADDARGVCLGVDLDAVIAANSDCPNLRMVPIEYSVAKQREMAKAIILEGAEKVPWVVGSDLEEYTAGHVRAKQEAGLVSASLRHHAPEFKNPCFLAEKEIRLITAVTSHGSNMDKTVYSSALLHGLPSGEVHFKERGDKQVPYVKLEFPLTAITEIWVGPRFGSELEVSALKSFLTKQGVQTPLLRSDASYRG